MRIFAAVMAVVVAGCTTSSTSGVAPEAGAAPPTAQQAFFSTYPDRLFFAAAETCNGPAQSLKQPSRNEVRCESLPAPQTAAAIILGYNGTVEDLPTYVIAFSGRATAQGYLVTADNYIRVPQRDGGAQHLRFPDPQIKADMSDLLQAAGGRPL